MTRPVITAAAEWRGSDGWSDCVMSIDLDGRLHISVHNREIPGFTASFSRAVRPEIAAFIEGDTTA